MLSKKIIVYLILPILTVVGWMAWYSLRNYSQASQPVKYLAYIGRYTNHADSIPVHLQPKNKFDLLHEIFLKEYLSRLQLPYNRLELKTFDCQKSGKVSDSIYNIIAQDSSIVAIIDNTWGQHLSVAQSTIRKHQLPIIAINADRNHLDYGPAAIFTGSQDNLPYDITTFITKILKVKKVNFISESDYSLHPFYKKAFQDADITIEKEFLVSGKSFTKEDSIQLYQSIDSYFSNPQTLDTWTVFNVHVDVGNHLLAYINRKYSTFKGLGHAYIVNPTVIKTFGYKNDNQLIIVSYPTDALSKPLYHDIKKLKAFHPDLFENPNHPLFVERCWDAVEMIKNKFEKQGDTLTLGKHDFRKYFSGLKRTTVKEEDEIYIFDSTNTVIPELTFTEYSNGNFHSYPLQLNESREVIPNLFFGMEIVDIYNIDVNANSFTSDFYYWVKLDSSNFDAEKYIIFQNMKQNESSRELIFEKIYKTQIYKLYKVSGVFYVNYELENYPFDHQEIYIRAEILNPSTELKVSFDQKSFTYDEKKLATFKINEWDKSEFYVTVDNEVSRGMHGDPDMDEEKLYEFKNIYFRLDIARKPTTPLLEIVLPLFLIGLISISLLFIKDISFENLGEVSIGVFMSIVAFSISFSDTTPTAQNLTKADYLFWLTFIIVLINFMIVIVVNAIYDTDKVRSIDIRKASVIVGIFYILLCCIILFI
ncbi:MAG: hypothetical protein MUE33_03500 [Cytophagaceae bacterium]|nr:hypothetical protein [Cytophagaceae bacterium]